MSIKDNYLVMSIDSSMTYDWLLNKHYAKRIPSISYAFGLYTNKVLIGVCTFGMPPSSTLAESICGNNFKKNVIELNRLVLAIENENNVLSYFVSKCINLLPDNKIIVSFADANMNHNGYIYQATNFIYTGLTSNTSKLIDKNGEEFHFRNIGHYQKNNKINAILIKKRVDEDKINKIEIANFLRENKNNYTNKMLDKIFGYKDTCGHWFRTDAGFSFPNVDDWIKLKEILKFDDRYDILMTNHKFIPCSNDIIKKLELQKIEILPKHRYIFFKGSKSFKIQCKKNFKYDSLPYPKGENKKYDSSYNPQVQLTLF